MKNILKKMKSGKQIYSQLTQKKLKKKIHGTNLSKEIKELYNVNFKTLKRETEEDTK